MSETYKNLSAQDQFDLVWKVRRTREIQALQQHLETLTDQELEALFATLAVQRDEDKLK